jgi:lipopolysaccharide export system ATP-binding protein
MIQFQGQNLHKKFGQKEIVKGVSFSVTLGESVGFLGPNGAGKTTCFLLMAGLLQPDQGKIFIGEDDITQYPLYQRSRLGLRYLPQEPSVFRGLSVEDNLKAVLELSPQTKTQQNEQLESLLTEFGLQKIRRSSAAVLSGGERRRLEIARALVGFPRFLLLDEPLAGIDPKSIDDLKQTIEHLKKRNIGVLISDHNVRETLGIVSKAYIVYQGKILKEGSPTDLANDEKVRQVYLGDSFSL